MILAVQVFNSPALKFKSEVFSILSNVAWTYLLHEHYERNGVNIIGKDGRSILLGQMINRPDCPLSSGVKDNIRSLKTLRDNVEHKILGKADIRWLGLFQACCLNFDKAICDLFGERLTLAHDLSFSIQFARMNIENLSMLNRYEIPPDIEAIDARLSEGMSEERITDLEYKFRVVYTLDAVGKSRAHFQFVLPGSAEGKEIRNVLVKHELADHLYPHKPGDVVSIVLQKTGKEFNMRNHTQAWQIYNVRPRAGVKQPENTNRDYCIYHNIHKDYTYSDQWIDFLIMEVNDSMKFERIKSFKI